VCFGCGKGGHFIADCIKTKQTYLGGAGMPTRMFEMPKQKQTLRVNAAPFAPRSSVSEILSALKVSRPDTASKLERKDSFELVGDEKTDQKSFRDPMVKALMPMIPAARGPGGLQVRLKLALGSSITTNSGLGKYQAFFYAGNKNLTFYNIASAVEFTSLDSLFDEVFIHSLHVVYKPRNKYNGLYLNSTATSDVNSSLATVYFLPHNSPDYTDSSGAFFAAAVAAQHKVVNTGEAWTFTARNPTKFNPTADNGDETTTANSMGWMQFAQVGTKYGGFIGMMLPLPTAVSGTASLYPESATFGDYVVYYDLSVRARA